MSDKKEKLDSKTSENNSDDKSSSINSELKTSKSKKSRKRAKSSKQTEKSGPKIVGKNNEAKLSDEMDEASIQLPFLMPLIRFSDWWAKNIRNSLASFLADFFLLNMPRVAKYSYEKYSDEGKKKSPNFGDFLMDLVFFAIKMMIEFAFMGVVLTLYAQPLLYMGTRWGAIPVWACLVCLLLSLIFWEEENRFFRELSLQIDKKTHNWLDHRISDLNGIPSKISYTERYRIGWLKGDWEWSNTGSWGIKTAWVFFYASLISLLSNCFNYIDTYFKLDSSNSVNIKAQAVLFDKLPLLMILISVFLAPVVEEFLFRGVLWRVNILFFNEDRQKSPYEIDGWQTIIEDRGIRKKVNRNRKGRLVLGAILTSILFAVAHNAVTPGYFLSTFTAGIILSYIYYHSGDIKYNIMTHMGVNFLSIFIPVLTQILASGGK